MRDEKQAGKGIEDSAMQRYVIGFLSALVLTLAAYGLVVGQVLTGAMLIAAIVVLAAIQLVVQLVCFLHFGSKGADARLHQATFYLMLIILVIIVGGSLWIMANLNYNMMMSPEDMDKYMLEQSNKGF